MGKVFPTRRRRVGARRHRNALGWGRIVMRTRDAPATRRRILCVSPRYAPSFGTFQYSYPLFGTRVRAFMPPQGLLWIANYLPECWEAPFVDENPAPAGSPDSRWADAGLRAG